MAAEPFEYAVLRVVPRVERGERVNVGVILFCRTRQFLGIQIGLDDQRRNAVLSLAPSVDLEAIMDHLRAMERIVAGDSAAGPIAELAAPERFRWLVSPSSTMIQPSEVHAGMTEDPAATLRQIFTSQVA